MGDLGGTWEERRVVCQNRNENVGRERGTTRRDGTRT
jgi:hypothetical protein